MSYTIIAYKPDSSDYCRGCHMASYSSDCEIIPNISYDRAIEEYARFICANGFLDYNELGYEITLLENGSYNSAHIPDIIDQGTAQGQALIETRKQETEADKLREKVKSDAAELERKRKQLETLKKELGEN